MSIAPPQEGQKRAAPGASLPQAGQVMIAAEYTNTIGCYQVLSKKGEESQEMEFKPPGMRSYLLS
jgi:hypothetical protein